VSWPPILPFIREADFAVRTPWRNETRRLPGPAHWQSSRQV